MFEIFITDKNWRELGKVRQALRFHKSFLSLERYSYSIGLIKTIITTHVGRIKTKIDSEDFGPSYSPTHLSFSVPSVGTGARFGFPKRTGTRIILRRRRQR